MNKRFKKEERIQFIQHFNERYQEEILMLAKILSENEDLLQAKFTDVNRNEVDIAAIERNGQIHQIQINFQKRIYTINEAEKETQKLLEKLSPPKGE